MRELLQQNSRSDLSSTICLDSTCNLRSGWVTFSLAPGITDHPEVERKREIIKAKGKLFCKGPESKYLRLCGPCGLCHDYNCHRGMTAAVDDTEIKECPCARTELYLQKQATGRLRLLGFSWSASDLVQLPHFTDKGKGSQEYWEFPSHLAISGKARP